MPKIAQYKLEEVTNHIVICGGVFKALYDTAINNGTPEEELKEFEGLIAETDRVLDLITNKQEQEEAAGRMAQKIIDQGKRAEENRIKRDKINNLRKGK